MIRNVRYAEALTTALAANEPLNLPWIRVENQDEDDVESVGSLWCDARGGGLLYESDADLIVLLVNAAPELVELIDAASEVLDLADETYLGPDSRLARALNALNAKAVTQ